MSGIAQVLLTLGYKVSGSDLKRSAVTAALAKRGAKIFIGHKAENIGSAHVVVVSSAVKEDNPEVISARLSSLPVVPRGEMLSELMRLKYGIAVAGTHGKTTTTSLIATILASAGLDPTIVVGGRVNSFKTNARLGKGEFLVAEADESDRSFLKLTPTIAVITNIDPEHMENYKNFEHVKETYIEFANKVPFYGAVVACIDHPEVKSVISSIKRKVITYGINGGEYCANNISQKGMQISFDAFFKGKPLGTVKLAMPGKHNVLNALAAIAVAMEMDVPFAKVKRGLSLFKGIERRFQVLLEDAPMIVSDYAHHPKEIDAVINSTREGWPDRRLLCVIQPHRFSRLKSLFGEFAHVLTKPDVTFILPVYSAGEARIENMTSEHLCQSALLARKDSRSIRYVEGKEKLFVLLKSEAKENDMILFLGAGDIWKTAKEYAEQY